MCTLQDVVLLLKLQLEQTYIEEAHGTVCTRSMAQEVTDQ